MTTWPRFARLLALLLTAAAMPVRADIRLPSVIGSHMVLQQKSEITLWGWCHPMENIRVMVDWDTTVYSTIGERTAKWSVRIKTPAAGGPYQIILNGYNVVVLEDVMIGEVWLCSGQSNMEWSARDGLQQSIEEAPRATNTNIRLFNIVKTTGEYPQENCTGQWVVCNPEDMKSFSAVGYFFGKKIQQELKVPVGLINASWGGTAAEVWTPRDVVEQEPALREAAAKIPGSVPYWPVFPGESYNAMIHPLIRFKIAGALWYQGESNVGAWNTYPPLLSAMVAAWREAWRQEFPFYFVQIAPYAYGGDIPYGAFFREAQTRCLAIPKSGMVVITDLVDDVKNIHPPDKLNVGLRLANLALSDAYGKTDIAAKSPTYKSMTLENNKIRIQFNDAEAGLMSKNGPPTGFYIAGTDHNFLPATASIEGSTVLVWNDRLTQPTAVRFGFDNTASPNLFGKNGLPVNLFRTDQQ